MSLAIEAVYQIDPAQVGDLAFVGDPNLTVNHLTYPVHPVWAYPNWSHNIRVKNVPRVDGKKSLERTLEKGEQRARCKKLPFDVFQRMLPALRLASLFLEKSLPWFWNLRYAPYKPFGKKKETELELDEGEWTAAKESQIRSDLNSTAQRYFLLHGVYGWDLNATAVSCSILANVDGDVPENPYEDAYVIWWQRRAHLLTSVAKESIDFIGGQQWLDLPLAIQQRDLFQFASLLVHELAHIVVLARGQDALINNEPYFRREEPHREAGFSWEYYMFGGIITVVDGEFTGNPPGLEHEGVASISEWRHDFQSHVQMFTEWKHPKSRMDDLMHPPGRWLTASKYIEQFFDMRRWHQWLAMPLDHGPMEHSPFLVHLSPSLFMSLYQETSMSYGIWYFRRLHQATGLVWPDVTNYESQYSDSDYPDFEPPWSPSDSENECESDDVPQGEIMDTTSG